MRKICTVATCVLMACSSGGGGGGDGGQPGDVYPTGRPAGYTNPIPAENALAGDPTWAVKRGDGAPSGRASLQRPVHIEAYADRVSAKAGETIQVMASIPSS